MKKIGLILATILSAIYAFGQLSHLKIPFEEEGLVDVEILAENTYILAERWNNKIYKTNNGGDSWTFKTVNTEHPGSNEGLSFINEKVGFVKTIELVDGGIYAGGSEIGNLYKTEDGGDSWVKITPEIAILNREVYSIGSFFFFNEKIGICHYDGQMWRTTNGGESWKSKGAHRENNAFGANEKGIAYFVQNRANNKVLDQIVEVFYTDDFGQNWQQIDIEDIELGTGLNKLYLKDKTAYISFNKRLITLEAGKVQNSVELPIKPFAFGGENDLFFVETTLTDSSLPAIKIELFQSTDLGKTLQSVDVLEDGYIRLMNSDYQHQTGVLVGTQGDVVVFKNPSLSTSTKDKLVDNETFSLSPNPIKIGQELRIKSDIKFDRNWTIRNYLGQTIASGILQSNAISLKSISIQGTYFLELKANGKTYTQKISVQ